jgi:murein L,D-transpeptidase YafK
MWGKNLKFFFILRAKNLQFRYSTWKRGKEIAKAYGSGRPLRKHFRVPLVKAKTALVIISSITAFTVLYLAIPSIISAGRALQKIQRHAQEKNSAFKHALVSKDFERQDTTAVKRPSVQSPIAAPTPLPNPPAPDTVAASLNNTMIPWEMNYCVLANKATRTLYLLSKTDSSSTWKISQSFSILVGGNEGQKIMAGDKRTPEGTYFIIGRKETEELNAIYGPLAYVLNYPNEEDKKAGRTGQGIWIHGTREDTTREATHGCIVLKNDNLLALAGYLQLGIGTPVIIVNMPSMAAPEHVPDYEQLHMLRERILSEYQSRQTEFAHILSLWKSAWESRDIDTYSQFYDAGRFLGEGMHWDSWREKKIKTFKAYSMISISMEKICVSEFSESTAVILFIQQYTSDVFHIQKPKKLSFIRSDGRWKIFREETFSRQELLL